MHPTLGGVIAAYPLFLGLATLSGAVVAGWVAFRVGVDPRRLLVFLLVPTLAALMGAKAYGLIEGGGAVGSFTAELFGNYRYPGAIVAWALTVAALARHAHLGLSAGAVADIVAPAFAFAMAVVRVGCLLAGCCAGSVCDLPWAIRFPAQSQVWNAQIAAGLINPDAPQSLYVHPLQIYFALLSMCLFFVTLWLQNRKRFDGEVFLTYVAFYSLGQFLLEFLRFGKLPHVQYLSLAVSILAFGALIARRGRAIVPAIRPQA